MLNDFIQKYAGSPASDEFRRLYDDRQFSRAFASMHERLNQHFHDINGRARTSRHYWAANSRDLLELIDEVDNALAVFAACSITVQFAPEYRAVIDRCRPWLSLTYGSEIPEGFPRIQLITYEPVFIRSDTEMPLVKSGAPQKLKMVGQGAYATVYSYVDPDYGIKFALKRAKKGLTDRDMERFLSEFRLLKRLSFPYVVEVYSYSDERHEYTMEFCHDTLRSYISRRNNTLRFDTRKRIALQFLYGLNYLHLKKILHRDVSLQNVLLKRYDDGAVVVKLSDFGLAKNRTSEFTRSQTEIRGTIIDPRISSFKDYNVQNEIFSGGYVLSFIFTGKESLQFPPGNTGKILRKCTALELTDRYSSILEIIADVDRLAVTPRDMST